MTMPMVLRAGLCVPILLATLGCANERVLLSVGTDRGPEYLVVTEKELSGMIARSRFPSKGKTPDELREWMRRHSGTRLAWRNFLSRTTGGPDYRYPAPTEVANVTAIARTQGVDIVRAPSLYHSD